MRSSLIAVLVLLSGCPAPSGVDGGAGGGSVGGGGGAAGGGGGGGAVSPLTFEQYCSTLNNFTCDYGTRCGVFETRTGCEELITQGVTFGACASLRPSVNDGRVAFDGTAAATCFRDAMSGCVQPASCGDFFTGQVALNGACFTADDCVAGTWCDATAQVCPGQCKPRAGAGASVSESQACLEGLAAQFGMIDGGFGFTCTVRGTLGQPCRGYGSCAADLVCNESSAVCETPRGPGVSCGLADGGAPQSPMCAGNLACQPEAGTGRFLCAPLAGVGQRCGTCRLDLRCASADGGAVCMARGLLDEACNRTTDCRAGLFCLPNSGPFGPGKCATPRGAGESCTGSSESCASGLRCNQVAPADGGFFPENRCTVSDGGTDYQTCVDPTP